MNTVSFGHACADLDKEDMAKIMSLFLVPHIQSGLLLNNNPYLILLYIDYNAHGVIIIYLKKSIFLYYVVFRFNFCYECQ